MDVPLTLAIQPYDRVLPLLSGDVSPDGIAIHYRGMPGGNGGVFYDQLKFQRYDVSEMSISTFLIQRATGWPYRMLPVFHNRGFAHTEVVVRNGAGIRVDHPEDLRGKRFAIRDYPQTAGLWIRGVLTHDFGVEPRAIEWYQTRDRRYSLAGATAVTSPVPIHYADADTGGLFQRGEIDAAWSGSVASTAERGRVSRGDVDIRGLTGVSPLFSDAKSEAVRFYRKTGIYPANHVTVIRESVLQQHPWVATSLVDAFESAKQLAMKRVRFQSLLVFPEYYRDEVRGLMGVDPHPYGLAANRALIHKLQDLSVEQGLTASKQPWSEIFAEEVLLSEGSVDEGSA